MPSFKRTAFFVFFFGVYRSPVIASRLRREGRIPKIAGDMKVYILYSSSLNRHYVGHSQDMTDRLSRHNAGRSKATKNGIP